MLHRFGRLFAAMLMLAPMWAVFISPATMAQEVQATPRPGCGGLPSGLLLAGPGFAGGTPKPGLAAIDPATGAVARTIDLPAVQYGIPVPLSGHALVQTLDGDVYVVDAAGTAVKIDLPSAALSLRAPQFFDTAGTRWTLLGDASLNGALLVDLRDGRQIDLKALLTTAGASPLIVSAAVASDDAHVLIWDGLRLFLLSTSDPTRLRPIGDESSGGSFSPDGTRIVYSEQTPVATPAAGSGRQTQLVVADAGGGARQILATGSNPIHARWIDNHRLAVDQFVDVASGKGGRFSMLDLSTGASLSLLSYPADAASLVAARAGRWLLHEYQDGDNRVYAWIDLNTGTLTQLPELTGLVSTSEPGARWTTFFDPSAIVGADGVPYVGLDMETGKTSRVLVQQAGATYLPISSRSPDGRYALLQVIQGKETRVWLLDNAGGGARMIGGNEILAGVFSPDGCWMAVVSTGGSGAARTTTLTLVPTSGGASISLGSGLAPIWLPSS